MSSTTKKIPQLSVEKTLWGKIRTKARKINRSKWDFPTLSCNEYHEVWYDQVKSWNRPPREGVNKEEFPFIDDIVKSVLNLRPRGGRFHLGQNEVFLTAYYNYKTICKIIV